MRLLNLKQVTEQFALSRSSIYEKLNANNKRPSLYDPTFPKPVKLSNRKEGASKDTTRVAWIESELIEWVNSLKRYEGNGK